MTPEIIARVDAALVARPCSAALMSMWGAEVRTWTIFQTAAWSRAGVEACMGGILLALVREAHGDPGAYSHRMPDGQWATLVTAADRSYAHSRLVNTADGPRWLAVYVAESEAASLARALEAAPKAVRS